MQKFHFCIPFLQASATDKKFSKNLGYLYVFIVLFCPNIFNDKDADDRPWTTGEDLK